MLIYSTNAHEFHVKSSAYCDLEFTQNNYDLKFWLCDLIIVRSTHFTVSEAKISEKHSPIAIQETDILENQLFPEPPIYG